VVGFCEHGNEQSGSVKKAGNFFADSIHYLNSTTTGV
jgi:hypothetical protein